MRRIGPLRTLALSVGFQLSTPAAASGARDAQTAVSAIQATAPASGAEVQTASSPTLKGAVVPKIARDAVQHQIRRELDGSGVSNLAAVGNMLFAVDPNEGIIHAYDAIRFGEAGRVCTMRREFAPWRTKRSTSGTLLLISEDERSTMEITRSAAATWPLEGQGSPADCGAPRPFSQTTDAPPAFRRLGSPSSRTLYVEVPNPIDVRRPARLKSGARGQILDVHPLGTLSGRRFAVLWKELDQWPLAGAPPASSVGRVLVNVWVSVFDSRGGLLSNILVQDVALPANPNSPFFSGLHKRGFEYAAVVSVGLHDWLYMLEGRDDAQVLTRFALPSAGTQVRAGQVRATDRIDLYSGSLPEPSQDPAEPSASAAPLSADADVFGRSGSDEWSQAVLAQVGSFAAAPWSFPAAALSRPCGPDGNDQCDVTTDDAGELVRATDAPSRLAPQDGKPARWIGPRQLIDAPSSPDRIGIPYSYGGGDTVSSFGVRLAAYGTPGVHPPIGNIKSTLSRRAPTLPQVDYPLGTDCSHFVAAVFGVPLLSTNAMITGAVIGPSGAYATPVPHLSQIRAGDVLVKDGHVVIFTRMVPIGRRGLRQASLGLEVFEATSRCGRVCRSVYEPDFFNGWWIVRMPRIKLRDGSIVANPNPDPGAALGPPRL